MTRDEIGRLRKGAHLAEPRRRWRKWVPWVLGLGILVVAVTALALLISSQDAAEQTASAAAIGAVDIGDATTLGVFPGTVDLTDLEPGFSSGDVCVGASLTDPTASDVPKMYLSSLIGTALADELHLVVTARDNGATSMPGQVNPCVTGTYQPIYNGPLSGFAADYASGYAWPDAVGGDNTVWKFNLSLPGTVDPNPLQGETTSFVFTWENQG